MLKYMCMKWGCEELWADNFDVLIFIECRTLNRLGPMTGRQFLQKFMEPIKKAVGETRYTPRVEQTKFSTNGLIKWLHTFKGLAWLSGT